jgi:hypothetical protein
MVSLLDLPRELRDLIYTEVILWEQPRPILGHPQWLSFRFRRVTYAQSNVTGEFGCAYSLQAPPSTCANFLCCNQQIHAEMQQAITFIEKKQDGIVAKLDCIAEDESFHYFTWLSVPLVKTIPIPQDTKSKILPAWLDTTIQYYLSWPHRMLSSDMRLRKTSTTTIPKLCIDIRLTGDRSHKWTRNNNQSDRTSWAVCAALKRLLDHGIDLTTSSLTPPSLTSTTATLPPTSITELILNVVPPNDHPVSAFLPEDARANEVREGLVHPLTVARELVDVWAKIWRGEEEKGVLYRVLLERIWVVGVCVDGVEVGRRGLGKELKRGRRERRRAR